MATESLDGFFTQSVAKFGARPALVVQGRSYSYQELNGECSSIEATLRAAGVGGRRVNVGLVYARAAFTYAAILAIMRSDSVYVPLNPKLPAPRVSRIIADAGLEAVIVDMNDGLPDGLVEALHESGGLQIIAPDGACGSPLEVSLNEMPQHRLWRVRQVERRTLHQESLSQVDRGIAYIIYTSGSTGIPKGVPITHASACACIKKSHRAFGTYEEDRFTQFSALSFDVSILDLFLCWKSGAALCVPQAAEAIVPLKFAVAQEITVWSSVPSLANILMKLHLLRSNSLPRLRLALFCGEALPCELAAALASAAPGARIINLYGPTECTIFATYYEYNSQSDQGRGTVSIGHPLPQLPCLIVDDGRVIEEPDVPGELWLSGEQLAPGYWNNPTASAAAFVRLPGDDSGVVWYRTGDLVSHSKDGTGIAFRGRLDRQVKLRGHRVELQEIESVLRDVIGCALVAVVPIRNEGGICEGIVAYCDRLHAEVGAIKEICLSRIPRYMLPDQILELDSFPLSTSGKVDYLALAARIGVRAGSAA
jgi:D-alanine--poly(phosphoribitol) ligase subunit 1